MSLNLTLNVDGQADLLTGTTTFSVGNQNQIVLEQFTATNSTSGTNTISPITLNRQGNRYGGNLHLSDANLATSWPDYTDFVIEIVDANDTDGDGVPDLSDALPPSIKTPPQNQTVFVGENAAFSVEATGTSPLSYNWLFNGTDFPGGTNFNLNLTNVQTSHAGDYAVVVTNFGGMTSSVAGLLVFAYPALKISLSGTNAILSWPAAPAGFALEANTNLGSTSSWAGVSAPTNILGSTNTVTLPVSTPQQFFRLKKP